MMPATVTAATRELLTQRLAAIEQRIQNACQRAGRCREDVTLIAVTKTVPASVASLLPDLGILHLGENRPQELWRKAAELPATVHWHLIGHLQRNKLDRTLPLVRLIHSVDRLSLLTSLEAVGKPVEILLEVNVSGEESKQGFAPEELSALLPALKNYQSIRLRGLMTMARHEEDPENCRSTFQQLRQLRDDLQLQLGNLAQLDQLSMGMSNDFEIAIEEGATLIRLGTVLLGDLPLEGV